MDIENLPNLADADTRAQPENPDVGNEELEIITQEPPQQENSETRKRIDKEIARRKAAEGRERAASERAAQLEVELYESRNQLQQVSHTANQHAEASINAELARAGDKLRNAITMGDADAIVSANTEIARLAARSVQPQPMQRQAPQVNQNGLSARSQAFINQRPWWNTDPAAKAVAIMAHERAISSGLRPDSNGYFEHIDQEVSKRFPEYYGDDEDDDLPPPPPRASRPTTAGVNRQPIISNQQSGRRQVKLTAEELQIAESLRITPAAYAAQKLRLDGAR